MFDYDSFICSDDIRCPNVYLLKDYGNGNQKLLYGKFKKAGFEPLVSTDDIDDTIVFDSFNIEESRRCSLSRSKREVREIIVCNDFKYFVTLTINSQKCDRYSFDECEDLMHKCFRNYQKRCYRRNIDFKYLVLCETHIDGAYHFHGVFTCVLPDDIYSNKNGFFSSHFFDENMGFNSFSTINNLDSCSKYITKYITKNCCVNSHNQVFFCSKGLKRPVVYRLPVFSDDVDFLKDFWCDKISNQFVKCRDFNYDDLDLKYKLWLQNKRDIDYENKLKLEESVNNFLDKIFDKKKDF